MSLPDNLLNNQSRNQAVSRAGNRLGALPASLRVNLCLVHLPNQLYNQLLPLPRIQAYNRFGTLRGNHRGNRCDDPLCNPVNSHLNNQVGNHFINRLGNPLYIPLRSQVAVPFFINQLVVLLSNHQFNRIVVQLCNHLQALCPKALHHRRHHQSHQRLSHPFDLVLLSLHSLFMILQFDPPFS